jgi:magnesium transporter
MIQVSLCNGQVMRKDMTLADAAASCAKDGTGGKAVLWVDVITPNEEDWEALGKAFGFHPLAIEDAQGRTERAKLDIYEDGASEGTYAFLSIRAWVGGKSATDDLLDATQEIDVFLGQHYIVTIHDGSCAALTQVRERWHRNPNQLQLAKESPAFLLYLILDAVVDDCFPAMDEIDVEIDRVETVIYDDDASNDSVNLKMALRLKKRLLLLRQTVSPLRDLTNEILRTDTPLFPSSLNMYFQDVYDHALRLTEQVDLHRDILTGAMDALVAQTGNRLNQVMKKMTGISTILMSAALIAGVYGMNFKNMPELQAQNGYYLALGGMALVAIVLAIIFRVIRWF